MKDEVLALVAVPEKMALPEAIASLYEDSAVVSVSLDYLYEPDDYVGENETVSVTTDDPSNNTYDNSWHLMNSAVYGAWSYVKTQGSVTVVVMDSGVDVDHPDLRLNLDLSNALDAYSNTPLQGDVDSGSHGTHVAGIVSARAHNGQGCAGVSYNAKVLPINVMNPSTRKMASSAIAAAFDHVFDLINLGIDNNIRVVNMSFTGDSSAPAYAGKLADALAFYDLTLVAAAGNDGTTAWRTPSDLDSCISVINVNADGFRHSSSNYGTAKDISAPGVNIHSTVDGGGFAKKTGTSMAAPIVSGVAALLYAANPTATAAEVKNALIEGATDLGTTGFDIYTANGMVNAADAVEVLLFGVNYRDVMTEEWYVTGGYLTYVVTNGLMAGYTSDPTSFGPDDDLTRAQFATVLYRMANPNSQATSNPDFYADNTTAFTDVQDGKWYTAAINWANRVGILTGDTATNYTTVRPNDPLTREEAAVMSYRFAGVVGASTSVSGMSTPNVADWSDVASWAQTAMKWCYHKNVIGKWHNGDGTYSAMPEENVTRAMMTKVATVLHRDIMP